jgi:toxin ParE1/3/4
VLPKRILSHVEQLAGHPENGSRPHDLKRSRYRQIVEPPCRLFYRYDGQRVFIVHVLRSERLFRKGRLAAGAKQSRA